MLDFDIPLRKKEGELRSLDFIYYTNKIENEFNDLDIQRDIEIINSELIERIYNENYSNSNVRDFLYNKLELGNFILTERKSINNNYSESKAYKILDKEIAEDRPKEYLKPSFVAIDENGKIFSIPVNDISWDLAFYSIAKKELEADELEKIYTRNNHFDDINLPSYNFAYEIEGGFNERPYESDFDELGFDLIYDASAHAHARYDEKEIRVTSYDKGNKALDRFCDLLPLLEEKRFKYSDSCGIHIHVSQPGNNFDFDDIIKIGKLFTGVEEEIYSFLPSIRYRGDYSRPMEKTNKGFYNFVNQPNAALRAIKSSYDGSLMKILGSAWYNSESYRSHTDERYHRTRYASYNVHSFFYRGTLEFRYFDANYEMLPFYLDFVGKMIEYAKNNNINRLNSFIREVKNRSNPLEYILKIIKVADSTKEEILQYKNKNYNTSFKQEYREFIS